MQRLPPLAVGFLMTVRAIGGFGKSAGLDEVVAFDGGIAWGAQFVGAEAEVIRLANLGGIAVAVRRLCLSAGYNYRGRHYPKYAVASHMELPYCKDSRTFLEEALLWRLCG